jgi:hypothetical protein
MNQPQLPLPLDGSAIDTSLVQTGRWLHPARVFLDLKMPHLDLARAITRADHEAIWQLYQQVPDQAQYLDWLADLAGNRSQDYPHRRDPSRMSTWRQTMIAAPIVVCPDHWKVSPPPQTDRAAAASLLLPIQAWLGQGQEAGLVAPLVPYADLCRWSPLTQQEYLADMAKSSHAGPAPWLNVAPQLSPELPQLSFLVGSAQRWLACPQLPQPGSRGELNLRERLAASAAYMLHHPVQALEVRAPMIFHQGVLEGLLAWLTALADHCAFRSWQLHPAQHDLVWLELTGTDMQQAAQIIPLRRHQIGLHGLDLIVEQLHREIGPAAASASLAH